MMPLVEELYQIVSEKWSMALGLLDSDEHFEYQKCCRYCEELEQLWQEQLTGDQLTAWKRYLANVEQMRGTEYRLCFARGLAAGLGLGPFALGQ